MKSITGLLGSAAIAAAMVSGHLNAAEITGAGASFPNPIYSKWADAYSKATGNRMNYQSIGSGGGINQITNRTVDFGATDAALTTQQLTERSLLQFPTVMGSVVLIVNLPGVADNALRLTAELVVDIFLGKITRWNDGRIAETNRDIRVPNLPISIAYRADASGTTQVFTTYLARVSSEWQAGPGAGTSVRWPVGNGARGNEGVANAVRNTPGAIGYTENAYATVNRLITTQLRNKSGRFVAPVMASFQAAATQADWSRPGFAADLIDLSGDTVWPIVTPTFILLPTTPVADRVAGSRNTMRFFDWAFRAGAQAASSLEYIPLPASVHDAVRAAWAEHVRGPGGERLWPVA